MYRTLFIILGVCFFLLTCSRHTTPDIVGQWQGIDEAGNHIRIAFTQQGEYHLSVNQNPLIGSDNQPLKYQLAPQGECLEVLLFEQESDIEHDRISRLQANFITRRQMRLVPKQEAEAGQGIQLTRL